MQIYTSFSAWEDQGYVFGDLRPPNILFDEKDEVVKLIDFDWCGRYERRHRDDNVESADNAKGQYAHYPLFMSRIAGMWAEGMEPLRAIQPKHDLEMLEKLLW